MFPWADYTDGIAENIYFPTNGTKARRTVKRLQVRAFERGGIVDRAFLLWAYNNATARPEFDTIAHFAPESMLRKIQQFMARSGGGKSFDVATQPSRPEKV